MCFLLSPWVTYLMARESVCAGFAGGLICQPIDVCPLYTPSPPARTGKTIREVRFREQFNAAGEWTVA